MKMNNDYKTCNNCGAKVDVRANFCPECKSQSFRKSAVAVRDEGKPSSFKRALLYWNYNGEYVLAKSKVIAICVFLFLFIASFTSPAMAGTFVLAIILSAITFVVGFIFHIIKGRPSNAVITYNDYGVIQDIIHLFFFWQNKKTGEFVLSKTKIISFAVFIVFALLCAAQYGPATFAVVILFALIIETPVFLVGWGIHKLTNPNPTNPKSVGPKKPPEKIEKKEKSKPKIPKVFKRQPQEPEVIPKFKQYEDKVNALTKEFASKEKVAREVIEKKFTPPQITYTRFISMVDKSSEVFAKESESALNILHLATEDSPRIDRELDSKIGIMESIIDKIDDLTNELILSMDSSKDGDVDNLIEDMEGLISSVKDYGE